ncbi:MAG: adenine phosphoribosyltransferase [Planctomycetota bacterium]|nr:adenine phosphoribosyltransferase [Planctomycetota bacterium]
MNEATDERIDFLRERITTVPDYPKPGIQFKDITTLLACPRAFQTSIDLLEERISDLEIDMIAAPESRGFLFGVPLALRKEIGFVPIRKPNKLPRETASIEYALEYGTDTVEMHTDTIQPGQKVLLVDDVLATGGTMAACCKLVEEVGGIVVGCAFLMELMFLDGRKNLRDASIISVLEESD